MGGEGGWVSVRNGSWHSPTGKSGLLSGTLLHEQDINKHGQKSDFVEVSLVSVFQAIIHFECGHTHACLCVFMHIKLTHLSVWNVEV